MKTSIIKTTILISLMGAAPSVFADGVSHQFTPIENLPPEIRQKINERLNELSSELSIDWEHVTVGLDENGKIAIVPRESFKSAIAGTFSCLSSASTGNENSQCK